MVPIIAVEGIWSLTASNFRRKSGVSWTYEGIWGTKGLKKESMKRDMCSVGEPLPEMMGLPGLLAL